MTDAEADASAAQQREIQELLARTRKTIAESRSLVEQASLRIAETDRFLAARGLTREQVNSFAFSREQILAVNEELRRRGLPPLEDDETAFDFAAATADLRAEEESAEPPDDDLLAERRRKFGNFMQNYRL